MEILTDWQDTIPEARKTEDNIVRSRLVMDS